MLPRKLRFVCVLWFFNDNFSQSIVLYCYFLIKNGIRRFNIIKIKDLCLGHQMVRLLWKIVRNHKLGPFFAKKVLQFGAIRIECETVWG